MRYKGKACLWCRNGHYMLMAGGEAGGRELGPVGLKKLGLRLDFATVGAKWEVWVADCCGNLQLVRPDWAESQPAHGYSGWRESNLNRRPDQHIRG